MQENTLNTYKFRLSEYDDRQGEKREKINYSVLLLSVNIQ